MENAERKRRFPAILTMFLIAVGCLALPLLFSSCTNGTGTETNGENLGADVKQEEEQPIELSIAAVGDVMVHKSQIESQYDAAAGKYDYTNNFKSVKSYISDADFAFCNVETTFAGKPYSGYPNFCAPDELADALKDAGFDMAVTSNNHMLDKGVSGMKRTLEVLRERGFDTAGSRLTAEEARYSITDVKGVKIAVVPYTYETGGADGGTALNGSNISDEAAGLINSFNYNTLDEDIAQIKAACEEAKTQGAEILILYFHWGEEYSLTANEWQREIAKRCAEETDVDIIFGSHPHVLQEMEYITSETTGKKIPVFYSMGNFISNQRQETLDNRYTEQGIIAKVNLTYMKSEGKITDISMSAVPTWVEKYSSGNSPIYEIIPLDENLQNNETLQTSGHLSRAQEALEDANGILTAD